MNVNVTKPVIIDTVDYENTPSIDFDLGSLNSFNLPLSPTIKKIPLSPRLLSPPNRNANTRSPSHKHKILSNLSNKLKQISLDLDPQDETRNEEMNVSKSLHSITSLSTQSTIIDLESEYDSIAVGKLQSLQLFDKKIASFSNIENLDRAYNLRQLNLHSNLISKIHMIDSLTKLKILNLSSNQIGDICGLNSLHALEELNLSSNRIAHIAQSSFSSQKKLIKLILSYNYIDNISALAHLQTLRYLDIKCNKICDAKQLQHLQHIQSLQTLIIEDDYSSKSLANPICTNGYKHIVADTLPRLKWLNMKLFDAESNASKIKLVISSPSPKKMKKKQIKHKSAKKKRVKPIKSTKKSKYFKKKKSKASPDTVSLSSSQSDASEDDTPVPISPPKATHKKEKRSRRKKRTIKSHPIKGMSEEEEDGKETGVTPRIDAVLNRFYKRSGNNVSSVLIAPPPPPPPPKPVAVVQMPPVPLTVYQQQTPAIQTVYEPQRIDFLVERLEKLFPHKMDKAKEEDKKEEEATINKMIQEERATQTVEIAATTAERAAQTVEIATTADRAAQTVEKKKTELSQDITNDFHINFGWNVAAAKEKEDEEEKHAQWENQITELKRDKVDLESALKRLQNELQSNMEKNKCAIHKLEAQINETNRVEMEKNALNDELIFRSNQVNETMQQLQQVQMEYKESEYKLTQMKKSQNNADQSNQMANKVQIERINELISDRNREHEKLLLSQQRNQLFSTEIANLKTHIAHVQEDKKMLKETVHKLNEATFQLNSDHQKYEELKVSATALSCRRAELEHDVTDLKTLLKTSLQNERKLKKTVLELNDVVTKQSQSILKFKSDCNELSRDFAAMRHKHDTNNVMKSNLEEKVRSMKQSNADLERSKNELRHAMESIQNELKRVQSEALRVSTEKNGLQEEVAASRDECTKLRDKIAVQTVMLNDQNESIAALKEDKNDLKDSIDSYLDKEKESENKENELLSQVDELREQLNATNKEELESLKLKANEYCELYEEMAHKLKEKEDIVQYVTNEVQQMKRMWQKEKKNMAQKYETQIEDKTHELQDVAAELSTTKQQLDATDNKLNSQMMCCKKWQKECEKLNAQKVQTEHEMRLILTQMERYKKTAAHFAKAFNV
eukprot:918987_1